MNWGRNVERLELQLPRRLHVNGLIGDGVWRQKLLGWCSQEPPHGSWGLGAKLEAAEFPICHSID